MEARRLGAIDVGSNAIRMTIAEVVDGQLVVRERERWPVRLGHRTFTHGGFATETIDAAVDALRDARARFDRHGVSTYRAIATSAVRTAHNREVLLHRVHHEASLRLAAITGDEEARLVRKATVTAMGEATPPCLLDLGGGSLEISVATPTGWDATSLTLGTVRLLETLGVGGALTPALATMVTRASQSQLASTEFGPVPGGVAAATGGNASALARWLGGPEATEINVAQLRTALPQLLEMDVPTRQARFDLRADRAEVIGLAGLIFLATADHLQLHTLAVPGVDLCDAILADLGEGALAHPGATAKAQVTAARDFATRLGHDTTHAEHVRGLALGLFDGLRPVHQLAEEWRTVLELAALLHDVGEVVDIERHHRHSAYLVRHAQLPGWRGRTRDRVACVIAAHRKSTDKARRRIDEARTVADDRDPLLTVAALLRLADGLDRDHRQVVRRIQVTLDGKRPRLELSGGAALASSLPKVELWHELHGKLEVTLAPVATA